MKGFNELSMNQATIQEAVEYYLSQVMFRGEVPVEVTSIDAKQSNFVVTFKPKEEVKEQ